MAARRRARRAAALFRLGAPETAWGLLGSAGDPRVQAETIHALAECDAEPGPLVARLGEEADPTARRGLLLALGDLAPRIPEAVRRGGSSRAWSTCTATSPTRASTARRGDSSSPSARPDPSSRSTVPWPARAAAGRRWFIDQGHTMVVIDPRGGDPAIGPAEPIDRMFAIADREVTLEQYRRFRPGHNPRPHVNTSPDCPAVELTWYDAAAYCRWLDDQDHLPEEECCYPPIPEIKEGMRVRPGYLQRTGHRLPTSAEWAYACRTGTAPSALSAIATNSSANTPGTPATRRNRLIPSGGSSPTRSACSTCWAMRWSGATRALPTTTATPGRDVEDPSPVNGGVNRFLRGGAYIHGADGVRADTGHPIGPKTLWDDVGCRVVRTIRANR